MSLPLTCECGYISPMFVRTLCSDLADTHVIASDLLAVLAYLQEGSNHASRSSTDIPSGTESS